MEDFRKKWKKDMKAALRELDGSVVSPDEVTKTQQQVQLEKAAPCLPSPPEFALDLATVASVHMHTRMKSEEKLENESILDGELGNPIVDESDSAPTTEQKPMKMGKQEKHAPPRPPPVQQAGRQKAFHVSPKLMLLKAQHALEERVATKDTKETKKKKDWRGANSTKRKRLEVESDSDTTTESEAHEEKPATKKTKGYGGKSLQPKEPKRKKKAKEKVPSQPQAGQGNCSRNQDPTEVKTPNEARDHGAPHANKPTAPENATSAAEMRHRRV